MHGIAIDFRLFDNIFLFFIFSLGATPLPSDHDLQVFLIFSALPSIPRNQVKFIRQKENKNLKFLIKQEKILIY